MHRICEPILDSPRFDLLRSYIDYALELSVPKYSCVVVLRVQVMGMSDRCWQNRIRRIIGIER